MRYGPEHSGKTRQRVIKIAAAEMRKLGPDNVSVADIMRRAGLTHGGFYAHFASKDDLIAAAIVQMFEQTGGYLRQSTGNKAKDEALAAYINTYVSAAHRDHPQSGCAIAALSSDIHRQGRKARAAYDAGVAGLVKTILHLLPGGDEQKQRALAVSMLAEMTGAVAAARAVSNKELSNEILTAARHSLKTRAGLAPSQQEGIMI